MAKGNLCETGCTGGMRCLTGRGDGSHAPLSVPVGGDPAGPEPTPPACRPGQMWCVCEVVCACAHAHDCVWLSLRLCLLLCVTGCGCVIVCMVISVRLYECACVCHLLCVQLCGMCVVVYDGVIVCVVMHNCVVIVWWCH